MQQYSSDSFAERSTPNVHRVPVGRFYLTDLEDWDFWLNFTTEQKTFIQIPETLFYRQRERSLTRNRSIKQERSIRLLSTIFLNDRDLYCKNINYFFDRWLKKTHPINSQEQNLFKRQIGRYSFSIQKEIKKRNNGSHSF